MLLFLCPALYIYEIREQCIHWCRNGNKYNFAFDTTTWCPAWCIVYVCTLIEPCINFDIWYVPLYRWLFWFYAIEKYFHKLNFLGLSVHVYHTYIMSENVLQRKSLLANNYYFVDMTKILAYLWEYCIIIFFYGQSTLCMVLHNKGETFSTVPN